MQFPPTIRRLILVALMVGATIVPASLAPAGAAAQQCPVVGSSSKSGEVKADGPREVSGIAASRSQPGVYWLHNDSGNPSDLYAVDKNGKLLMRVILKNTPNWDYEDIAIGPGPDASKDYIYIADVGANKLGRDSVRIFRLEEPKVTRGTKTIPESQVKRYFFAYQKPSGNGTWNRNAESMAIDPITGDIVVVEKHLTTVDGLSRVSWVYRIKQSELVEGKTILAKRMVAVRTRYNGTQRPPTAAEFSPDGKVLFIKNNNEIMAWTRTSARQSIFDAMKRNRVTDCVWRGPGGEAITVAADGKALYSIPEGRTPDITKVNVKLPDPGLTCDGVMANIKGTGANNTLNGTSSRDVIHGRGGNDTIKGLGGNDVVCGGGGNDVIYGDSGGDRVFGGAGADKVHGGPGIDALYGSADADKLYGQEGSDWIWGNGGSDDLFGGSGYDRLNGGPGADDCSVGEGNGTTTNC